MVKDEEEPIVQTKPKKKSFTKNRSKRSKIRIKKGRLIDTSRPKEIEDISVERITEIQPKKE